MTWSLALAIARVAKTRAAATANVARIPIATASGRGVLAPLAPEANAKTAPMMEAPVISPRLRDRLSMPDMTPR